MPIVSLTRLRIRSLRFLPTFYLSTLASARQAQRTPGFLVGLLAYESARVYWTFSVWSDKAAMNEYRGADAHRRAMPKLLEWCDEASVAHFQTENSDLPNCAQALERMVSCGRITKVRHPSAEHKQAIVAPARREPKPSLRLKPKSR